VKPEWCRNCGRLAHTHVSVPGKPYCLVCGPHADFLESPAGEELRQRCLAVHWTYEAYQAAQQGLMEASCRIFSEAEDGEMVEGGTIARTQAYRLLMCLGLSEARVYRHLRVLREVLAARRQAQQQESA
jgi:hypothetical protein